MDRQVSTERHTNERRRELPPIGSSKGYQLGQRHNSEVRPTDKAITSTAFRDKLEVLKLKGEILDFSFFNNSGNLVTDNGDQYEFSGSSWNEQPSPKTGDIVRVTLSDSGMVDSISYLNASNPPPLSNEYNKTRTGSSNNILSEQEKISLNIKYIKEDDYNFVDWVLEALSRFADLGGRARRKEFWYFYLANIIFIIIGSIFPHELIALVLLLLFIPSLSVTARRLHDVGRSGLWILASFIPLLNFVVLFFLCTDTSPKNNRWGAPARRVD